MLETKEQMEKRHSEEFLSLMLTCKHEKWNGTIRVFMDCASCKCQLLKKEKRGDLWRTQFRFDNATLKEIADKIGDINNYELPIEETAKCFIHKPY